MSEVLVTQYDRFERVELVESRYETLLADLATRIFPDHWWFKYKPLINSVAGGVQPDAALISATGGEWWVVEIELARHWLSHHVEEQLTKLRDGWYGRREREYLAERYPASAALVDSIARTKPKFLIVLDEVSGPIEKIARGLDFEVVHVLPYVSGQHLYAVAVNGIPRGPVGQRAVTIPARLVGDAAAARFVVHREEELPHHLSSDVLVGSRLVKLFCEIDRRGFVIALSRSEVMTLVGESQFYGLTIEADQRLRLAALPSYGGM